jgi:hypothetical protein
MGFQVADHSGHGFVADGRGGGSVQVTRDASQSRDISPPVPKGDLGGHMPTDAAVRVGYQFNTAGDGLSAAHDLAVVPDKPVGKFLRAEVVIRLPEDFRQALCADHFHKGGIGMNKFAAIVFYKETQVGKVIKYLQGWMKERSIGLLGLNTHAENIHKDAQFVQDLPDSAK